MKAAVNGIPVDSINTIQCRGHRPPSWARRVPVSVSRWRWTSFALPTAPRRLSRSGGLVGCGDDLLGGVGQAGGGDDLPAARFEELLAGLDVGPFEADDQWDAEVELVVGGQEGRGDDVAPHDAAEDVDEHGLDVRRAEEDAEALEDLVLARAAADVEEVGGLAAVVLDQVHGAHRQPGAIDEAGDVAVEADVAQAALAGAQLGGVLLGHVEHRGDVGVAEQRVVVEIELAVERQDVARLGDDQGVDFGERGVLIEEELHEALEEGFALLGRLAGQAQGLADLAGLEARESEADVDRLAVDLLGRLAGDGLDLDAPLGRGHQHGTLEVAVDRHAEVQLAGDLVAGGDEHLRNR